MFTCMKSKNQHLPNKEQMQEVVRDSNLYLKSDPPKKEQRV